MFLLSGMAYLTFDLHEKQKNMFPSARYAIMCSYHFAMEYPLFVYVDLHLKVAFSKNASASCFYHKFLNCTVMF